MSPSALALSALPLEEPSKQLLRSGFSGINNALIALMPELSGSEFKLLMVIARKSNGFLRRECVIGETELIRLTGLSRNSFYRSKQTLQRRGYLIVINTLLCCRYELADSLQSVKTLEELLAGTASKSPKTPHLKLVPTDASASDPYQKRDGDPSQNRYTCKESKEKKQHTQQQAATSLTEPEITADKQVATNDDVFDGSRRSSAVLQDAPLAEMVGKLRGLGIQAHVAQQLVSAQPVDVIKQALERVAVLKPRSPAGFVVSELQRGGYGAMSAGTPDANEELRKKREQIAALRAAERVQEKIQQETAHQRTLSWLERFQELPQAQQAQIREQVESQAQRENFTRIAGWGDQHPVWLALLAEVMGQSMATDGGCST